MLVLIRIQKWLINPKVWRFVCFLSSIVGLICYALSSSFNHLFGKWIWWKISLYLLFSLFIGIAFLFPKSWESSSSSRLQAHMAFLVLMITSVYSFFLDKDVEGKPDAYSLISSAAFAIMSLGMSRLSHYGFEVDLLYFFSGVLVVQLMKIKLWLVIVGGGFSYSLITLRSTLDASGYHGLQLQDHVVIEISSNSQQTIPNASQLGSISPRSDVDTGDAHLLIVMPNAADSDSPPQNEDLRFIATQVDSLSQQDSIDSGLLMEWSMRYVDALKKENGKVVNAICKHVAEYLEANVVDEEQIPELGDCNLVLDTLPSGIINGLNKMLRRTEGVEEEWCRMYINWRREFLEECLSTLGLQVEELNTEDVHKMTKKIEIWIKASNVAVTVLFPNEWRLLHRLFHRSTLSANMVFTEVYGELAISLLSFANTLETWTWSHSPTPLSSIMLNVFTTSRKLMQELPFQFSKEYRVKLTNQAQKVHRSLGIITEFVSITDGSKAHVTVPSGELDPFTRKVMNYILGVSKNEEGKHSLCAQVAKITERLESFLEAKSKYYNDPTLGYFFMMNNRSFIDTKAKLSGLETILGEDWLQNNTTKFQHSLDFYQRSSWNKMVDILKLDIDELEFNVAVELMKDKLRAFNKCFNEISNLQATWVVSDKKLKEQIIRSIENNLLPAYGNFVRRFQDFLGNQAYEYIKYGIFDVQDRVSDLFLVTRK